MSAIDQFAYALPAPSAKRGPKRARPQRKYRSIEPYVEYHGYGGRQKPPTRNVTSSRTPSSESYQRVQQENAIMPTLFYGQSRAEARNVTSQRMKNVTPRQSITVPFTLSENTFKSSFEKPEKKSLTEITEQRKLLKEQNKRMKLLGQQQRRQGRIARANQRKWQHRRTVLKRHGLLLF